jgi:TPR repeat protein
MVFLYASNLTTANKYYAQKEYKKALKIYQSLKKKGNLAAMNNLAMMYYKGQGTLPDQVKAVKLLETLIQNNKLKKREKSIVLYNLARFYFYGFVNKNTNSLNVDRIIAKELLKESIKLGNKKAESFYNAIYFSKKNKDINNTSKK